MDGDSSATDYLMGYRAIQERIATIVVGSACDQAVPSCPGWRVHDVVAHLVGLCEDWVRGHLDGYASDAWTADQVARYLNQPCEEILEAWSEALGPFARVKRRLLRFSAARMAFGDAVIHEADIRGALRAGRVPHDAVVLGLEGAALARWSAEVLQPAELPLRIVTPEGGDWRLGCEDGQTVVLQVPAYELFRALAGRRSAEQVREWDWSSDPDAYIQENLPYPFRWAGAAITD